MEMEMEMMGSLKHQTEALKLLHELHSNRKVRNNSNTNSTTLLIAERARESLLARLVDILSQIISIEQDLMRSLSGEVRCFLRHKVRPVTYLKSNVFCLFVCFCPPVLFTFCFCISGQRGLEEHLLEDGSERKRP